MPLDPTPPSVWLETESEWDDVAERLYASQECVGFDTETVGCDPDDDTAVGTARVVVFSLAIPDGVLRPRGYREATGLVLPARALGHSGIRRFLEDPSRPKVAHNGRYDRHACANEGVSVRGLLDTVDIYRTICPGRERYGLKYLVPDILNWEMVGKFEDVFSEPIISVKVKRQRYKVCVVHGRVNAQGGRKYCEMCRDELVVMDEEVVERKELKSRRLIPLQEVCGVPVLEQPADDYLVIRPGEHRLWETFVTYAGADAIGAAQLYQVRTLQPDGQRKARVPVVAESVQRD